MKTWCAQHQSLHLSQHCWLNSRNTRLDSPARFMPLIPALRCFTFRFRIVFVLISDCGHGFKRIKRGRTFVCVKIKPHKCPPGYHFVRKGRRLQCVGIVQPHHKCPKGEHLVQRGRKYTCVKPNTVCKRNFRAIRGGNKIICKPVKKCPKGYLMVGRGLAAKCKPVPNKNICK